MGNHIFEAKNTSDFEYVFADFVCQRKKANKFFSEEGRLVAKHKKRRGRPPSILKRFKKCDSGLSVLELSRKRRLNHLSRSLSSASKNQLDVEDEEKLYLKTLKNRQNLLIRERQENEAFRRNRDQERANSILFHRHNRTQQEILLDEEYDSFVREKIKLVCGRKSCLQQPPMTRHGVRDSGPATAYTDIEMTSASSTCGNSDCQICCSRFSLAHCQQTYSNRNHGGDLLSRMPLEQIETVDQHVWWKERHSPGTKAPEELHGRKTEAGKSQNKEDPAEVNPEWVFNGIEYQTPSVRLLENNVPYNRGITLAWLVNSQRLRPGENIHSARKKKEMPQPPPPLPQNPKRMREFKISSEKHPQPQVKVRKALKPLKDWEVVKVPQPIYQPESVIKLSQRKDKSKGKVEMNGNAEEKIEMKVKCISEEVQGNVKIGEPSSAAVAPASNPATPIGNSSLEIQKTPIRALSFTKKTDIESWSKLENMNKLGILLNAIRQKEEEKKPLFAPIEQVNLNVCFLDREKFQQKNDAESLITTDDVAATRANTNAPLSSHTILSHSNFQLVPPEAKCTTNSPSVITEHFEQHSCDGEHHPVLESHLPSPSSAESFKAVVLSSPTFISQQPPPQIDDPLKLIQKTTSEHTVIESSSNPARQSDRIKQLGPRRNYGKGILLEDYLERIARVGGSRDVKGVFSSTKNHHTGSQAILTQRAKMRSNKSCIVLHKRNGSFGKKIQLPPAMQTLRRPRGRPRHDRPFYMDLDRNRIDFQQGDEEEVFASTDNESLSSSSDNAIGPGQVVWEPKIAAFSPSSQEQYGQSSFQASIQEAVSKQQDFGALERLQKVPVFCWVSGSKKSSKGVKMKGVLTRSFVECDCCKKQHTLMEFLEHAKSSSKIPYADIYLVDKGISIGSFLS